MVHNRLPADRIYSNLLSGFIARKNFLAKGPAGRLARGRRNYRRERKMRTSIKYSALAGILGLFIWILACSGGGGGSGGGSSSGWSTADYAYLNLHNASYLDGHTVRWPNVPIGVSAPEFPEARAAFERWTTASGGKVRFAFGGSNITVNTTETCLTAA